MAWKHSARFLSWIYILSLPASFRDCFKTGPGGMLSTSENTKMRSKDNSQGECHAAPQKNSRWKVKGSVHKDKSTLEVGTESRLRPSSLEAETRKQALSGNQQTCSWVIPATKTVEGSSWGSVFKCMVFIGGGFMPLVFRSLCLNQCLPPLLIYYPQISNYFNEWLTEMKNKSRISYEHSWSFHSVPWSRSESIRWPSVYQMA